MQSLRKGDRLKAWPALAICLIQGILFLAHQFILATWIAFWPGLAPAALHGLRAVMLVLAFSFAAASLLSFRSSILPVRAFYWLASVWLGFLNYFFWMTFLLWAVWYGLCLAHLAAHPGTLRPLLAAVFYGFAALLALYGFFNARILRIRRISLAIPNLPASWKGRRAVLFSDLHLGAIQGRRFCRRLVATAAAFNPDIVFLPGDVFDGTRGDHQRQVAPLAQLHPPLGVYFSTGNHEEFGDPSQYLKELSAVGIRVLGDALVDVDGVQVAGLYYHTASSPLRIKAAFDAMKIDRARPAILLNHAPARLPAVAQAGFDLQLSGHTHGGQFLPFTWITRRVYGQFTTGLHRFGALQVYTSTGAGSWGPPMRVGAPPEMVVLTFS